MAHHPQSNGRDERFHRSFREELPIDPGHDLFRIRELIEAYQIYYNQRGPHSALHCLRPVGSYRGNPKMRLAERERKLQSAAETRRKYWGS